MHRYATGEMVGRAAGQRNPLEDRSDGRAWACGAGNEGARFGMEAMKPHRVSRYPARSPEETAIRSAFQRCTNPKNASYHRYGGRGIRVCEEWCEGEDMMIGVLRFMEHIGSRPSCDHSLDRIDNDGHYEPGNVRWATAKQQSNNKSNNVSRIGHVWERRL